MHGTTIVGTVLEHLVGAKLELAIPDEKINHKTASTADASSGAAGDFELADSVIHVTTMPSEALIEKCENNLRNSLQPIVICPQGLKNAAVSIAADKQLENRIEFYVAQEFISMNINELSRFSSSKKIDNAFLLISKYNQIIDKVEPDKSLKIETKGRK